MEPARAERHRRETREGERAGASESNALQFGNMPLQSFIEVPRDSHFPLENLPFGVFKTATGMARVGVALGQYVVDLAALDQAGHLRCSETQDRHLFSRGSRNAFLARWRPAWQQRRAA